MIHGIDTSFLLALEIDSHPDHAEAHSLLAKLVSQGDRLALTPQVLDEYLHVATDQKRFFPAPNMVAARLKMEEWWLAKDVEHVFPTDASVQLFLEWVDRYRLGRKRLLDTMLATTYLLNGVSSILTFNPKDFSVFGCFTCPDLVTTGANP